MTPIINVHVPMLEMLLYKFSGVEINDDSMKELYIWKFTQNEYYPRTWSSMLVKINYLSKQLKYIMCV